MNRREKQVVYRVSQALVALPFYRNPMAVQGVSGYAAEAHDAIVKGTKILMGMVYDDEYDEEPIIELEEFVEGIREAHQLPPYRWPHSEKQP